MSVYDLKKGESGEIVCVNVDGAAGERLASLGVVKGVQVTCLDFSMFKGSVLISVGANRIGLRKVVASRIEVRV